MSGPRECPKCEAGTTMQPETFEGIEIEWCPRCEGILLDQGELKRLIAARAGDRVDDPAFSDLSDEMDVKTAHCSACNEDMDNLLMPEGVCLDVCPSCKVVFLDQGELANMQIARSS